MLLFALIACFESAEPKACDTMASASVTVTVTDESGGTVAAPTVSWSRDGGAFSPCEGIGDTWACGWEVAGEITVRVEAAGYETVEKTYTIEQGECHVEQQVVTIELPFVACDDYAAASVMVTVVGAGDEVLSGVAVTYQAETGTATACDAPDVDEWVCGWEVAGDITITAVADGHAEHSQVVVVEMTEDLCHVVTEEITLALEWLPD